MVNNRNVPKRFYLISLACHSLSIINNNKKVCTPPPPPQWRKYVSSTWYSERYNQRALIPKWWYQADLYWWLYVSGECVFLRVYHQTRGIHPMLFQCGPSVKTDETASGICPFLLGPTSYNAHNKIKNIVYETSSWARYAVTLLNKLWDKLFCPFRFNRHCILILLFKTHMCWCLITLCSKKYWC